MGTALALAGRSALAGHKAAGTLGGALAGIQHVWLDGKVKAAGLDWNLQKINAPAAWSTGATGKGVKVAVIDTGIDTTHPDLSTQVTESVNFSDAPDALDHVGHGTHVAGTIAGTGAASGGARKGAAYGASLLNVKVLNDDGEGMDSSIIVGMEWAAQHGAKVADLSLGGQPTDGTDPDSQALNQLTTQYGTLFVVAAGNNGRPHTIATPGAADAALTVAATDRDDAALGLVARQDTAGGGRYTAVAPDVAVAAAVMQRQLALLKVQSRIDTLMQTYRSRAAGAGPPAQLLSSPEEIRECFVHLQRTACQEVLSFTRLPFALALDRNDTELEMLERGVGYRAVYERAVLAQPGAREQLRGYLNAGEQARAATILPSKFVIADRHLAMIAVRSDQQEMACGCLLIRTTGIVDALTALFEHVWDRSVPLQLHDEAGPENDALTTVGGGDLELLALMLAGLPDKALASQLGLSVRTVHRRIRRLMSLTGSTTRMQLGWYAARTGLL
ncbi:S8 family serine peptidase [Streptomyces mirabilis]|uniref:S8 family serine peptidase n=1 Tax=Streptomyces mirabilis TaxID=68239 RepID=UPI0031BACEEB